MQNDHDGDTVTAKVLEAPYPRRGLKVLYNRLTRDYSLRALFTVCCGSGIGSFGVVLSERVAYRTGRYTDKQPAFRGGARRRSKNTAPRRTGDIDGDLWISDR